MEINKELKEMDKRIDKLATEVDYLYKKVHENPFKQGKNVRCVCGYAWMTKSLKETVSCPSCNAKVKI